MDGKINVISLGGSLIAPKELPEGEILDLDYANSFKSWALLRYLQYKEQSVVIVGGGDLARRYQQALASIAPVTTHQKDLIGISATHMNARFVQGVFNDDAEKDIITDPTNAPKSFYKPILVAGGWKPGSSTDYVAVLLAKKYGVKVLLNLSNISHVFSVDPKVDEDATRFDNLSWDEYIEMIPPEWSPGAHFPFDPVASREAKKSNLEVVVCDGKKFDNLSKYLNDERGFEGTIIKD